MPERLQGLANRQLREVVVAVGVPLRINCHVRVPIESQPLAAEIIEEPATTWIVEQPLGLPSQRLGLEQRPIRRVPQQRVVRRRHPEQVRQLRRQSIGASPPLGRYPGSIPSATARVATNRSSCHNLPVKPGRPATQPRTARQHRTGAASCGCNRSWSVAGCRSGPLSLAAGNRRKLTRPFSNREVDDEG